MAKCALCGHQNESGATVCAKCGNDRLQGEPKRRWWRRKRTWAVVALLVFVLYPLSTGPAVYIRERGWIPQSLLDQVWGPPQALARSTGEGSLPYRYLMWFARKAWADHGLPVPE